MSCVQVCCGKTSHRPRNALHGLLIIWSLDIRHRSCNCFGRLPSGCEIYCENGWRWPATGWYLMTKICAHVQELGVDPNLYSYVFGESVLNDAVAIVLYRSVRCALQNVANVRSPGFISFDQDLLSCIWQDCPFLCVVNCKWSWNWVCHFILHRKFYWVLQHR